MAERTPPARRLDALLDRFPSRRVVVVGDLMLDQFLRGKVSRISPEAPVPVVAVTDESWMPGGAGNVCSNLAALGASVSLVSVLGDDPAGHQLLGDLRARGLDVSAIVHDPARVTTQKCRVVAEHQQVVRVDRETVQPVPPAVQRALCESLRRAVKDSDALLVSDYGKGVITRATVAAALSAAKRHRVPVLVDPKVEHFKLYRGVDCITPNTSEAWGGMRLSPKPADADVLALGRRIVRSLRLRSLLITRSEKGMTLFEASGRARTIAARAREVYDVTGAGDTVVSVMALALACGARPFEAAVLANAAAGVVVGKLG
ncbi:MAG: D-glycero-beta-D-manno-heptose-7-phosphate kinase, partial [Elusimicrobia bacterium]|nr:D-glycero-beta-D-manno-heptose-7-phosphate kinase [Elusimicrobiota bacterium]